MKKVVAERLDEMLEEFGSWVEYYRVRLDEEVLVVAFDLCSSSMIIEQLLLGGDVSCLTDLLTAIKRHLAAELSRPIPRTRYARARAGERQSATVALQSQ